MASSQRRTNVDDPSSRANVNDPSSRANVDVNVDTDVNAAVDDECARGVSRSPAVCRARPPVVALRTEWLRRG